MNDCITTTKQSTTKPCAYFLGYTVSTHIRMCSYGKINFLWGIHQLRTIQNDWLGILISIQDGNTTDAPVSLYVIRSFQKLNIIRPIFLVALYLLI